MMDLDDKDIEGQMEFIFCFLSTFQKFDFLYGHMCDLQRDVLRGYFITGRLYMKLQILITMQKAARHLQDLYLQRNPCKIKHQR